MSLHCPSCGTADDGTINGYAWRAHRAEAKLEEVEALVSKWKRWGETADARDFCEVWYVLTDEFEILLRTWP